MGIYYLVNMLIPKVNNYSWYPISFHRWVDDPKLVRLPLSDKYELRYNLRSGKAIVIRSRVIEHNVKNKLRRYRELKNMLGNIKVHDLDELKRKLKLRKEKIIQIFNS